MRRRVTGTCVQGFWPERYSTRKMLDKVEAKAEVETALKPIFTVEETTASAGESEDMRMKQLELESGEMVNGKDWVRIYERYVKRKNEGDEAGMQSEFS